MAKREKSNDALDILLMGVADVKEKIIEILQENNTDDKIILDIMELFQEYFGL
jgi:hypothetical protein